MNYHGCPIVKIDKDHYRIKRNGQIKEFVHNEKEWTTFLVLRIQ